MKYVTLDGDVLDAICWKVYGSSRFDIGLVYDANPGLERHGSVLSRGLEIEIPDQVISNIRTDVISLTD